MPNPLHPSDDEKPLAIFYGGTNGSGKSTLRGEYQDATIEFHFAVSPEAAWSGNFRDLSSSVERMITLSKQGVIDEEVVQDEIHTLKRKWKGASSKEVASEGSQIPEDLVSLVLPDHSLNLFEHNQLNFVLRHSLDCPSYAALSRLLYGDKAGTNAAQKSRAYLMGYGLELGSAKQALAAQ